MNKIIKISLHREFKKHKKHDRKQCNKISHSRNQFDKHIAKCILIKASNVLLQQENCELKYNNNDLLTNCNK